MEISKHIGEGFGKGELYGILVALNNGLGVLPVSGETYYVSKEGNGTTGLSWDNAFTTIASAITASRAYTAVTANQYRRNRIYVDGGTYAETLTVFPNNCDVVGVGQTGSTVGRPPTIQGTQSITTPNYGCRWYNMVFSNNVAANPIVKTMNGCLGIEFHKCVFTNGATSSTIGLQLGLTVDPKVIGCKFNGNPPSTIGIQIDGTHACDGEIIGNQISATTTGISIAKGATSDYGLLIKDNIIFRADPNSADQMAVGIDNLEDQGRTHIVMVHNWISAVDGIAFGGAVINGMTIDNHLIEGTTGVVEFLAS